MDDREDQVSGGDLESGERSTNIEQIGATNDEDEEDEVDNRGAEEAGMKKRTKRRLNPLLSPNLANEKLLRVNGYPKGRGQLGRSPFVTKFMAFIPLDRPRSPLRT